MEDKMSEAPSLQTRLQKHLAETGTLSEADVATFTPAGADEDSKQPGAGMSEDTQLPSVDPGVHDDVDALAGDNSAQDTLTGQIDGMANLSTPLAQPSMDVTITPEDKEEFIRAIISGDRMQLQVPVCGGKLRVALRNRTMPETQAIIAQLRQEMDSGEIVTNLDYSVRLRAMLMAAQVAELQGVVHPTLDSQEPLRYTQDKDEVIPPGWLDSVKHWATLPEGLHAVIWNCVWEFETKYWAMVQDAKNQDFWLPEASTSE
jgi:hypothetical protein